MDVPGIYAVRSDAGCVTVEAVSTEHAVYRAGIEDVRWVVRLCDSGQRPYGITLDVPRVEVYNGRETFQTT